MSRLACGSQKRRMFACRYWPQFKVFSGALPDSALHSERYPGAAKNQLRTHEERKPSARPEIAARIRDGTQKCQRPLSIRSASNDPTANRDKSVSKKQSFVPLTVHESVKITFRCLCK